MQLTDEQREKFQQAWDTMSEGDRVRMRRAGIDSPEQVVLVLDAFGQWFASFSGVMTKLFDDIGQMFAKAFDGMLCPKCGSHEWTFIGDSADDLSMKCGACLHTWWNDDKED